MADELQDMENGARTYFDDFEGGERPAEEKFAVTEENDPVAAKKKPAESRYHENGQLKGGEVGADGKVRSQFGSWTRVTDHGTGEVTWERDGKPSATPQSVKRMEDVYNGRRPGANSWDEAVQIQRAEQQADRSGKALDYTRRAIEFNRQSNAERKRRRAQFDAAVGDQLATALDALNGEDAVIKEGKDGRRWKMGYVNAGALGKANEMISSRGGRDSLGSVIAYQRVDKYGNPVGEAQFALTYRRDGNLNENGEKFFRKFSMADAVKIMADAQRTLGNDEASARNYAVNALRGANPFGWDIDQSPVAVRVERERGENARSVEREQQRGKLALAKLTGQQQREIAEAADRLKKYGIDVQAEIERKKLELAEKELGVKKSAPTFNKAIYERLSEKKDRLLMKDPKTRTKEENEELKRIQDKLRAMEGDDQVVKTPEPWEQTLQDGDTQGGEKQGKGTPAPAPKPGAAQGRGETQPSAKEKPSKKEADAELKRREAERVAKSAEGGDDEAEIRKAAKEKPSEVAKKPSKWDEAKEAEFQEWFKEWRDKPIYKGMSEETARDFFEKDWWRKFKNRVKKNLDDMDNRRETKSTGRRATGLL